MRATYDKEADAMYISVKKGKVRKTLRVSEGVHVDVDGRGRALGIELLFMSSRIPRKSISKTVKAGIPVSAVAA